MHKNNNKLWVLAFGAAVVATGSAASVHATPAVRHAAIVADSTVPPDTTKPDTTKPDTTKKPEAPKFVADTTVPKDTVTKPDTVSKPDTTKTPPVQQ